MILAIIEKSIELTVLSLFDIQKGRKGTHPSTSNLREGIEIKHDISEVKLGGTVFHITKYFFYKSLCRQVSS